MSGRAARCSPRTRRRPRGGSPPGGLCVRRASGYEGACSAPSALALALLALAACAPRAVIPDAERQRVFDELAGQPRWLRVAAYAAPLWGDRAKVLLTDAAARTSSTSSRRRGGAPVPPPAAERILPPGTAVRIRAGRVPDRLDHREAAS